MASTSPPSPNSPSHSAGPSKVTNAEIERQLLHRLSEDDESALTEIAERTQTSVLGALRSHFRDQATTQDFEDAYAETLWRLYERRVSLDVKEIELGAWMYVVARNLVYDQLRKQKTRSADKPLPPSDAPMRWSGARPSADTLTDLTQQAIRQLSDREQRILKAYLDHDGGEGWTEAVAKELQLTPTHVRVIRHRVFSKIRRFVIERLGTSPSAEET